MVDIETLGTKVDSVITQIGACYFDRYSGKIGKRFLANVEINSCLERGFSVTGGSIKFWLERKENATFLKKPIPISKALAEFGNFINKKAMLWSHVTFDMVLLKSAYQLVGQGAPFSYRNTLDIRTLVNISGVKPEKKEGEDPKSHDALEDCLYQVEYCTKCFNALKENDGK